MKDGKHVIMYIDDDADMLDSVRMVLGEPLQRRAVLHQDALAE